MPRLLILSKHAGEYSRLIEEARLPKLELVAASNAGNVFPNGADCEIVFGEPSLSCEVLPTLGNQYD